MPDAASYSAADTMRDGWPLEVRALRPEDRADLLAALARLGDQSLRRRFFGARRDFTEREIAGFVEIDFVDHVALVAVAEEDGRPVIAGGARYVVLRPGSAEVAFAVVDEYQGRGVGTALMRHIAAIARGAGLRELVAEVLPENAAMLGVLRRAGVARSLRHEAGVVHVAIRLS